MHRLENAGTTFLLNVGICQEPQMSETCKIARVVVRPIHYTMFFFMFCDYTHPEICAFLGFHAA
jgi:hypothetical protein